MRRLSILLLLTLAACGKRGDPRPPVPLIPQATSNLAVAQRAGRIVLSWSYPSLTTTGRPLPQIRRVVLYRYAEELPATAPRAESVPPEPGIPPAVTQFAGVPTLAPPQFTKLSTRVDSIEGANLAGATVGSRLTYEESPPFLSPTGRQIRYTYAVVTEGISARSDLSNLVSIVPLPVAEPPGAVTATAKPEGIVLSWNAPTKAAGGGENDPIIVGYNIYRGREAEAAGEFESPINTTVVTDTNFTDSPPYGEHHYRVTAVASSGPPRLESEPSAVASATFRDLVPPPPPTNVSVLVETRIARVLWDAAEAPDVKGYHVYRWEGSIRLKLTVGPTTNTYFGDESVDLGIPYRYAITTVDTSNNESEPAFSREFIVPKTP